MKESMDREQLIRYLLGQLNQDELAEVEARYFADRAAYDDLRALEDELFHDYAQNQLSPANRRAFEERFLVSKDDRRRLQFAKALATRTAPKIQKKRSWLPLWLPAPVAAAAVVILGVSVWLFLGTGSLPEQDNERAVVIPDEQNIVSATINPAPGTEPVVLLLAGTQTLELNLQLEGSPASSYRGIVRAENGNEIWMEDGLAAISSAAGFAVRLRVPASLLSDGKYRAEINGAVYTFTLRRR